MTGFAYQLYSSRKFGPLPETLTMLARLGYSGVEGYGGLVADETDPGALRAALDAAGLAMPTVHLGSDLVGERPARAVEIAGTLGVEAIFVPFLDPGDRPGDADGWHAFGTFLEEMGKPIRDAGLAFGWHNHAFEFEPLEDGSLPIDHLLAGGPDLAFEIDLAWVARAGQDPLATIENHKDRIIAAHIKDIAPKGEAEDEDGWADVGHGTLDLAAMVGALRDAGVRHLVMEHDNPSDDRRFAERSLAAARQFRGEGE